MRNKTWFWPAGISALLIMVQCLTVNQYRIGKQHFEMENYDAAIQSFEIALQTDPDNLMVKREMGIAHYLKPDFNAAIPILLDVFLADTTDGRTIFYLGTAYEHIGKTRFAIDMYRRYTDVSKTDHIRESIENRLERLIQKEMTENAMEALANESAIVDSELPDDHIAVLYFKNLSKSRKLNPIQKGLADMVITDLSQVQKLSVVERVRLQKLLQEMELGQTGIVDDATAPRVGKLLGASRVVQGTFLELSKSQLRIDGGIANLKSNKKSRNQRVQGQLGKFYQLEKELVFKVIDQMGIQLTLEERDAINIIPTENLLAFMAYCKGLDLEDQGKHSEAAAAYREALELDPDFKNAAEHQSYNEQLAMPVLEIGQIEQMVRKESIETMQVTPVSVVQNSDSGDPDNSDDTHVVGEAEVHVDQDVSLVTTSISTSPDIATQSTSPTSYQPAIPNVLINQMVHSATVLDQVFLPGLDSRESNQEQRESSFGSTPEFYVKFALPTNDR